MLNGLDLHQYLGSTFLFLSHVYVQSMLFLLFTYLVLWHGKESSPGAKELLWFTVDLDSASSSSIHTGDIIPMLIQISLKNAVKLKCFKHHSAIAVFG